MKSMLRKVMYPLFAAASLAALDAGATDITLVNQSSAVIHPWYRSPCWDPTLITGADPATGWVFFGGVNAHGQFTWTAFETLLTAACQNKKNPKVEFTFTTDLTTPPLHPARGKHVRIDFGDPVDTITVVDNPTIQPGDGDNDDDDN